MGLASDRTVYSLKRNRPLLLYGRLLDDSRPSHGLTATNPDYFLSRHPPAIEASSEWSFQARASQLSGRAVARQSGLSQNAWVRYTSMGSFRASWDHLKFSIS